MIVRRHLVALLAVFALIVGFTVSSTSMAGASPPSATVPAAPTSLQGYRGNGSAEIGFTAGANGGAAITNYKYSTDNGGSWTAFSPAVTTPSVTIGGLTNDTTYSVKLRAVNSAGDGAVSDAVSVTPADVNAINWTGRTAPETNNWTSVAYGNGQFVALSWNGTNRVMTSPDGITWTARSTPSSEWKAVTYGNGQFVAVADYGTDLVMTSPDGITWTARTAATTSYWSGLTFGNGVFVAVAWSGDTDRVMTSPDGITWTVQSAAEQNGWKSVTFGNGTFVAVSFNGTYRAMTSTDGITWTAQSAASASNWNNVTYGNGTFVAVANNGTDRAMTSTDGITWTARSAAQESWQTLTYGNGNFVAAANSKVMISTNGITWTSRPAAANNWSSMAYGNGKFVAVANGNSPSVMTSEFAAPSTPDAPTSLTASIAKASTSVSFTAGADGGSSITNYEYQLNGSGAWTALSPADTSSPVTIPGLTNGTPYTVKLRAVNALGAGTASSASASFTPLLRLVTPAQAGTLSILAGTGSWGTPTPGTASSSALGGLDGVAVDSSGNVYIADRSGKRVYKISAAGTLSIFAGTGSSGAPTPGTATSSALRPAAVAVDSTGNVYVADSSNRLVVKITPDGTLSIVAGTGSSGALTPGPATTVNLSSPSGVAVDSAGNLFILDSGYRRVLKVTTGGTLSVVAGSGTNGAPTQGEATSSSMNSPRGIAVDSSGNLYITDGGAQQVLKVTSGGTLSIFAGTGTTGLPTPGAAASSNLGTLNGVAVDSNGNVFITDSTNNLIEKITPAGALTVVAGTGYQSSPTPGPIADSELGSTTRVATDSAGNIYILDSTYYLLEKVTFRGPTAPTDLVATPGDRSASIAFTAGSDGGVAITKYQYRLGAGSWVDAGLTSPISITGLVNFTTYSIQVRAVNAVGAGTASPAVTARPQSAGPTIGVAYSSGKQGVQVGFAFTRPAGSTLVGFTVRAYAKGTTTVVSSCQTLPNGRGCYVPTLTSGTEYDIRVQAYFTLAGETKVRSSIESATSAVRVNS
ncbi:MAG: hypothetical protein F2837_11490 [Actinobacteria bacterium]|uniref:Unannotated protein n=1 Tax=freshwater metagenome TaxID=449393 RepID=A0A6J7KT69_9ZZZZ|nr:hypothetical protein [Actinomycetota bacterium]